MKMALGQSFGFPLMVGLLAGPVLENSFVSVCVCVRVSAREGAYVSMCGVRGLRWMMTDLAGAPLLPPPPPPPSTHGLQATGHTSLLIPDCRQCRWRVLERCLWTEDFPS